MRTAPLLLLALAACVSCHSDQYRDFLRTRRSGPSGGDSPDKADPEGTAARAADLGPITAQQARLLAVAFVMGVIASASVRELAGARMNAESTLPEADEAVADTEPLEDQDLTNGKKIEALQSRALQMNTESMLPEADQAAAVTEQLEDLTNRKKIEALQSRISDAVDSLRAAPDDGDSNASTASKGHLTDDLVKKALKAALQIFDQAAVDGGGSVESEGRRTNEHRAAGHGRRIDVDSLQAADEALDGDT